jgi:hypothetical protein
MKSRIPIVILFLVLPLFKLQAQNTHFWDGIETFDGPTDENPILAAQLDFYFDKMVAPLPDSITLEISRLVEITGDNADLRDFILWHLLEKYQHPEYMSQDQMFVWLYDQYFSQLEIKDLNETNLALIHDKAERLRRLALFNIAPNFMLNDSIDLQHVESEYTVLFFFDHDCEVCQQEMQDLDSVIAQRPEITVLAIDLNPEGAFGGTIPSELMGLYDIETTPLVYVLDRDKRIIAKKIRAKQIELIVNS